MKITHQTEHPRSFCCTWACWTAVALLLSACTQHVTTVSDSRDPELSATSNDTNCSNASDPNEYILVKIFFSEENCPLYVDNPAFVLQPSQEGKPAKVVWQAHSAGNGDKLNNNYQIYFDPFKDGRTLRVTNGKGCKKSGKLDREYPSGDPGLIFEYVITSEHSEYPAKRCPPLDPRFLVD